MTEVIADGVQAADQIWPNVYIVLLSAFWAILWSRPALFTLTGRS